MDKERVDLVNEWRDLKSMMKALADMARLAIVYHIAHTGEITVTELTDLLDMSQPLVSWHLRKLRRANLVQTRRVGRQVYCSLNRNVFSLCLSSLERLVDPAAILTTLPAGAVLVEPEVSLEDLA